MTEITAVILTKNEEGNIAGCLESLLWVQEIIVVDAQSTDQTVEIARQFASHVLVEPWKGFGPQKNYGIERAKGLWILIVDADERVTEDLRKEIQALLNNENGNECVGYRIPRRNFFYGYWLKHGGMFPDYQLRLFRKAAGRYNNTLLHENLILSGPIEVLNSCLDHHSMPTISHHVRKMKYYTSLAAQEKLKTVDYVSYGTIMGNHFGTIVKSLIIRKGWKDGLPGLIASIFAGLHTFVKYVKAHEIIENRHSASLKDHVTNRV